MSETRRVSATLPKDVVDQAEATLKARGSTLTDFIRMSLRSMAKAPVIMELEDEMTFGKYRGETLETVIRTTPDYIEWLEKNNTSMVMSDEAKNLYAQVHQPKVKKAARGKIIERDPDLLTLTTTVHHGG